MEMLDIFDSNHNHIGIESKQAVHEKGLWHQVTGCIFIDSTNNTIYLQYKSASHNQVAHTNKIDISVGGHILAGEPVISGLRREIKEESSLNIKEEDLFYIGTRTINVDATPTYKIREFCYMYLYDNKLNIDELHSMDDEVLYYISFDIDRLLEFITTNQEQIVGTTPFGKETFNRSNFIKGYIDDKIYEQLLLLAKSYIGNKQETINNKLTK